MTIPHHIPIDDKRHVLIFGKEHNEEKVKEQLNLLTGVNPDLTERDIRITVLKEGSKLYSQYKVKPTDFTVILIGKDGTEKLRTRKLLQPAELFAIIDAMPMRKREMRNKKVDLN